MKIKNNQEFKKSLFYQFDTTYFVDLTLLEY